jgi:hypothetical protein
VLLLFFFAVLLILHIFVFPYAVLPFVVHLSFALTPIISSSVIFFYYRITILPFFFLLLFITVIPPFHNIFYGCETWSLISKKERCFAVSERIMLTRIFGYGRKLTLKYTKFHNFYSKRIICVVKVG